MALVRRRAAIIARIFASVAPLLSARCEAAWMTGPSAVGSEKGTPISTMSTPAASSAGISSCRRLQVRVARRQVGDERLPPLFFQRRESLFDPSHYPFSLPPLGDGLRILVSPAGEVDDHDPVPGHGRRRLDRVGDGMGALQRGDDPLAPAPAQRQVSIALLPNSR